MTALVLAGCSSSGGDNSGGSGSSATTGRPAAVQKLVDAAKQEGKLTLYGIPDPAVLHSLADAFNKEYGVPIETVRLVSSDLAQRYASEAKAGAEVADAILLTHSPFFADAFTNKWLRPLDKADLPGGLGKLPKEFLEDDGGSATVSLVPTQLVYNTDEVKSPPKSWKAYADPKFKGKLLMDKPSASPAALSFWALMLKTYGPDYLQKVGKNNPTWMDSAVPVTQGVAAGEGVIGYPGVLAIVQNLKKSGAPVELTSPTPTTGPEIALGISANSPHPNAAKLFAYFMLSGDGAKVLAKESGALSPLSAENVKNWDRPTPVDDTVAKKIESLLGSN
jgi:iron(III) transport system substrate-binding protein